MVKHDALKNHLETLRNSIPELRGVLLASNEGLPVAHSLSNGSEQEVQEILKGDVGWLLNEADYSGNTPLVSPLPHV